MTSREARRVRRVLLQQSEHRRHQREAAMRLSTGEMVIESECPHSPPPLDHAQVSQLVEDYLGCMPESAVCLRYGLCREALRGILGGPKPACLSECCEDMRR